MLSYGGVYFCVSSPQMKSDRRETDQKEAKASVSLNVCIKITH